MTTSTGSPSAPRSERATVAISGAVALGGALVAGGLAHTGVLPGPLLLVVLACAALVVPTSRTLAGRVLTSVAVLSALCFVSWMVPGARIPRGDLLAAGIGAVASFACASAVLHGRGSELMPRLDVVDWVAVPGAATVAAWAYAPYVFAANVTDAVSLWARQWDNSSHSFMIIAMRHNGQLLHYAPPSADGSLYALTEYPAAYHANAATLLAFLLGHGPTERSVELLGFVQVVGLLSVTAAVLAACAVAVVPGARRNALAGATGAGLAASAMIAGPGALGTVDAHYNFPFAVALVAVAFGTMISASRVWDLRTITVLVCVTVMAVGSWLPLGVLAGLAACGIALPPARSRWRGSLPTMIAAVGIVVTGAALCVLQLTWALRGIDASSASNANGGIDRVLAHQFTFAAWIVLLAALWLFSGSRRALLVGERFRVGYVSLLLLGLGVVYLVAASGQLAEFGEVRYYPIKIQDGFVDLALIFLGVLIASMPGRSRAADEPRPLRFRLMATGAGLASLFAFGLPFTTPLTGKDEPLTVAALMPTVQQRPDLVRAIQVAQGVPATQKTLVILTPAVTPDLVDSVLVAAARGTYSNDTSTWVNTNFGANLAGIDALASRNAADVRAGRVVVITTPELAPTIKTRIPMAPAGAIRT